MPHEPDERRRRLWRHVRRILLVCLAGAALCLVLAPSLVPSRYVADAVRRDLEAAFGRPVRVSDCRIGWLDGVTIGDIRIDAGPSRPGDWLVHIEGLSLKYQPWELPVAATSSVPRLGRATVRRLALRAVRDEEGRLHVPQMSGTAPDFKSIEVLGGGIELEDRRAGTRRLVTDLRVTLGRLAGSERAYVTASGRLLFPEEQGDSGIRLIRLNGLLDHFDLGNFPGITGGCDVEWENVDLVYFVPTLRGVGGGRLVLQAPTDGQAKLTIDASDLIRIDGSISASRLVLGQRQEAPQLDIDRLTLGFTGSYNKSTGHATLEPMQISGAGSSLKVRGRIDRKADGLFDGRLSLSGSLGWTPLKEDVLALGTALGRFSVATGTARIETFEISVADSVLDINGTVNLGRTELAWRPWLVKPLDRHAVLFIDARLDAARRDLELRRASVVVGRSETDGQGEAGSAELELSARTVSGPVLIGGEVQPWSRPLEVDLRVADVTVLSQHVPAAEEVVNRLRLAGDLLVRATVQPQSPGIAVTARLDGHGLSFETGPGAGKAAGAPFGVLLTGNLRGAGGWPECNHAELVLGDGLITFDGAVLAESPGRADGERRVRLDGRLDCRAVQEWLRLARPYLPARPFAALVGNLSCDLSGHWDRQEFFVDAHVEATRASVELSSAGGRVEESQRLFVKPLGKVAEGRIEARYFRAGDMLEVRSMATVDDTAAEFDAAAAGARSILDGAAPRELSLKLALRSGDVEALLRNMPAIEARAARYRPAGAIECHVSCTVSGTVRGRAGIDLTRMSYEVPGELAKVPGLEQSVAVAFECPRRPAGGAAECRIEEFLAVTGPSRLSGSGRLLVDVGAVKRGSSPADLVRAIRSADASAKLEAVQDESLAQFSRRWREMSAKYAFEGRAVAEVQVAGTRDDGQLQIAVDASEAGFQYGEGTHKPVGTEAQVRLTVRTGAVAGEIALEHVALDIGDTHAMCSGTVYCRGRLPHGLADVAGYSLHLEGRSAHLARLAQLVPLRPLRELQPQGGISFALDVAADPYGVDLERAEFRFDQARLTYGGTGVSVDGHVSLGKRRLLADALRLSVGDSSVVVAADLADPMEAPAGQVSVTGDYLDVDALLATFGVGPVARAEPPEGIPPGWRGLSRFLSRASVSGRLTLNRFLWTDEGGIRYDWTAFASDLSLSGGRLDVSNFKAVMLGGVVVGRVGADLAAANPEVTIEYAARNLGAGEGLAPLISRVFPSMSVSGQASQTYEGKQRLFATREEPSHPVGVAYFEATDGALEGPAAPKWMSDLLPGLKLTTYSFRRMESVTTMEPGGRAVNEMLFAGTPYAIYISGHTEADGRTSYILGVDLFNSLEQGEFARSLEQGRIPLLRYNGRIVDSKWEELDIGYLLPHEVAYEVFLKRNLVYKLLRRKGETRRPNFEPYDVNRRPAPTGGREAPANDEKGDAAGGRK